MHPLLFSKGVSEESHLRLRVTIKFVEAFLFEDSANIEIATVRARDSFTFHIR